MIWTVIGARALSVPRAWQQRRHIARTLTKTSADVQGVDSNTKGGRTSAAVSQGKARSEDKGDSKGSEKLDLQPPKGTRDFYPEEVPCLYLIFAVHMLSITCVV